MGFLEVTDDDGGNTDVDFNNLYPAMIACFGNIVLGYLAGRFNLLSQTEAKGINTFIANFSLPSLIFLNLVEMDVYSVNWRFVLAIFLAKLVVFILVIALHMLLMRPINTSSAGILAIFATQSNDFAIGYPIVTALYANTHPDFARYIYLVAPINLAILNPIAFILIEMGSYQRSALTDGIRQSRVKTVFKILKNVLFNPVVFVTLLGIICNFALGQKVPVYLREILSVLGKAFSACALFILGLRMVGKINSLRGVGFLLPGLLIFGKLLALPELIRQFALLLNVAGDSKANSEMSTFGFLYGTFPSAPTVFVFACKYAVEMDLIATAMVACTFLSAPLIFVSAKLIAIKDIDPSHYIKQINLFTLEVSIIGLIASVWVLFIFVLTKKINKVPHKFTACLLVSHIFSCIGAILYNYTDDKGWVGYIQFCFFTGGIYSTRMWTAVIAITLLFMECRSLCYILFKLQPFFMLCSWGLPIVISILLLVFDRDKPINPDDDNPYFIYGVFQAIVAVSLLVLCSVVTLGCLILNHMYKRRHENYWSLGNESMNSEIESSNPSTSGVQDCPTPSACGTSTCCGGNSCTLPTINESAETSPNNQPNVVDIEDLFGNSTRKNGGVPCDGVKHGEGNCPSGLGCAGSSDYCTGIIRQFDERINDDLELIEEERSSHDPQILQHSILLILLLFSMFFGLTVSIWTVIMEKMTAIYIELAFLDVSFNMGQSVIILAVFFSDTKDTLLPLLKRWRKLLHKENKLILPMESELGNETLHICEQFKKHHLSKCKRDIQRSKRWRLKVYEDVFSGRKFVDWLIEVGLARDRTEGVNYARHLIEGRIVRHINEIYHFYDKNLLYTFN